MKRLLALSLCVIMALALMMPAYAASPVTPSPSNPSSGGGGGSVAPATTTEETIAGEAVKTTETTQSKANADGSVTKTTTRTSVTSDGTSVVIVIVETTKKDGTVTKTTTVTANVSAAAAAKVKSAGGYVTLPIKAEEGQQMLVNLPAGSGAVKVQIPTAKNATIGTVLVVVDKDGNEKIIKTSIATEYGVAAVLESGATVKVIDNTTTFADAKNHWAEDAVTFAASRGIVSGVGNGNYDLEGTTNRAMVCTVLARFDGADMTGGTNWYDAGANWAKKNGISDGTDMMRDITREELVTMLYRYAGPPAVSGGISAYADASQVSDWAVDAMQWAVSVGLIKGVGNNTLAPNGITTRAQLATVMQRFCTNIIM